MFAPSRARQLLGVALALTFIACGGSGPTMSEAAEQAEKRDEEAKKAKEEEDKKLAEQAKKAKENVLENPWHFDEVKSTLVIGTLLEYEITGTDAKGDPVEDGLHAEVVGGDTMDAKILQYKKSQEKLPAVKQPQGHPWANLSPFFWVEQSEVKVDRRETIEVPAGSFDCVVADITGFFGNHLTVWMIEDKPGIYAQVVEHPNTKNAEEGDATEITYRLASITKKEG